VISLSLGGLCAFRSQRVDSNLWATFAWTVPWKIARTELVPAGAAARASCARGRVWWHCTEIAVLMDLFSLHGFQFTNYCQRSSSPGTSREARVESQALMVVVHVWLGAALVGLCPWPLKEGTHGLLPVSTARIAYLPGHALTSFKKVSKPQKVFQVVISRKISSYTQQKELIGKACFQSFRVSS